MSKSTGRLVLIAFLAVVGVFVVYNWDSTRQLRAADAPKSAAAAVPVETDMHEFMEYLFQPTYKRLVTTMAAEPDNKGGWRGIKSDGLILAEGGNLLLARTPETDGAAWNEMSVAVRDAGTELYRAGKARDFAAARKHYEVMLQHCNRCHDRFADGEHQLAP